MRRRFVIGVDELDPSQEIQFRDYIKDYGAWWHWIDNMWLMTTQKESISVEQIRDKLLSINPEARILVFEFPEDIDWACSVSSNSKGKTMSQWLVDPWGKE